MLACMKLGAVLIPATTLLTAADLTDRVERGRARTSSPRPASTAAFEGVPGDYRRIVVGGGVPGLDRLRRRPGGDATARSTWPWSTAHPRRRHAAALLHVRDDRPAQAGRAHARVLPGRAPVDDVLDRPAARRRPPQHLLPGLGQARVELVLRAVERRGDDPRGQPGPLRRGGAAGDDGRGRATTFCAPPTVWRMLDPAGPRARGATGCRCARWSAPASR